MPTLFLKYWRDLFARRWQALGLLLLVAVMVAAMTGAERAKRMLANTRATYYEELAFADLEIRCSPSIPGLLERVRDVPDVADAEEVPLFSGVIHFGEGEARPAFVRVLPEGAPRINQLALLEGHYPAAVESGVVLDRSMVTVFGLGVGDTVELEMHGERRSLPVVGISVSPDHILYPVHPDYLLPVPGTVAALSLSAEAAKAYPHADLVTAIWFRFEAGADAAALEEQLLDGLGISPIAVIPWPQAGDHRATAMIFRFFDIYLPASLLVLVFVALTLLVLTLRRLVMSQRTQIGALAAQGHRPGAIAAGYILLPAVAALFGSVLGTLVHAWYGRFIFNSYVNGVGYAPLRDPGMGAEVAIVSGSAIVVSAAIAFGLAFATAARRPLRLMHPVPPRTPGFRPLARLLAQVRRVIRLPLSVVLGLSYLSRQRWASVATVLCLAANLALVVSFLYVHVTHITETDTYLARLGRDATVHFSKPVPDEDLEGIARQVGGVVEPMIQSNLLIEFPHRRLLNHSLCLSPDGWISGVPVVRGRALMSASANEVLIDQWVSDTEGVDVGDTIDCFPWYSAPESRTYEIVGVLGGPSHGLVVLPLDTGRGLLGLPGLSTALSVGSDLPTEVLEARLRALPEARDVQSLARVRAQVGQTFAGLRRVLILVVVVAVLLAALFLALLAALDTAERAPDLAVLRAVGWRERSLLSLCITEVVTRGWLAYLLSIPLAPLLALWLIEQLRRANCYRLELVAPSWVSLVVGLACLVLMPLGALPAWRAARRVTPGESLRLLTPE